jgi:hypothetical protein
LGFEESKLILKPYERDGWKGAFKFKETDPAGFPRTDIPTYKANAALAPRDTDDLLMRLYASDKFVRNNNKPDEEDDFREELVCFGNLELIITNTHVIYNIPRRPKIFIIVT